MILIAPTAFKGTLSAADVAAAAARGARTASQDIVEMPVSDGGPGLIDALKHATGGAVRVVTVEGPLAGPVQGRILEHSCGAVIECADACGLHLCGARREPMRASTFGVGQLLRAASNAGHIYVGVGGSATIDGGLGMAEALGYRLLDQRGRTIERGGRGLVQLAHIEGTATRLPRVTVLTDVRNPLTGARGAARVFGPQKGASPEEIERLDAGLAHFAEIVRRDLGSDLEQLVGGGAAGGLAAGLHAFTGATLVSGSEWVLEQLGFENALQRANVVVTGEGSYDAQSTMGKITGEILRRAARYGTPVLLITGSVSGPLPDHVRAAAGSQLTLDDIEQLVRDELPQLLRQ